MRYKENRRQEAAEEVKKQQPRSLAVRQHGIEWKQCERVPSHFHEGAARHRFESGRGSTHNAEWRNHSLEMGFII